MLCAKEFLTVLKAELCESDWINHDDTHAIAVELIREDL